jgi:PAS domain S-box-containing protein
MKAKQSLGFEFFDPKKGAWYEVHLAPSSEGVSVHIYNITRRKEAEVVLNENEAHFRQVADQAPVMIWMAGPDALSQYFNERWLKFRGHKLDQELGDGWAKGIHPHEREERIDTYLRAFHARESFRVEYRLKRADGRYRWILDSGVPRFSLGKFLGYIGSAIDITARKEAEDRQILEHKITQHLTEEASLDATLEKIMQIICEGLDWQLGAYWQVEPLLKQVRCRQTWSRNEPELRRFIEKDKVTSFNYGVGLPGRVWSLGKAFWILDIIEDPNFIREAAAQQAGLRSGICFPIRLGEEILGVMEFFSQEIQEPDANLLQMLESIGVEIGQFIERIKTKEALKTAYEEMEKRVQDRTAQLAQTNEALLEEIGERKKVEKEVLEISQKEQRRFGAHLHDDLCQDLSGIMMLAKVLMQNLEGKKIPEWEELKHITYLLDQSISQAKEMARGLYPIEVKSDSLMISLRDLTKRLEGLYQISCRFICPDPVLIEDNNLATHLYRIAQEAVQNAIKHGEADQVDIRLLQGKKSIVLTIHDNGHGLRPDTRSGTGIGLQIMKYRARMIDAELKIQENPEGGMLLTCSFSRTKYENHSSYAEETSAGSTSGEARV